MWRQWTQKSWHFNKLDNLKEDMLYELSSKNIPITISILAYKKEPELQQLTDKTYI